MNKRIVSIFLAVALLIPTTVFAGDEGTSSGSFTLSNIGPEVTAVALWDTAVTPAAATAMDPQVEFNVKVTVTDNNTLDDLSTITVTIFYDAGGAYLVGDVPVAGHTQTAAILTWTNLAIDTWEIDANSGAGTWSIVSANCALPADLTAVSSGTFEFHFIPGKVATETITPDKWHIYAEADDGTIDTHALAQEGRTMDWYGEITAVSANVGFGTVALGSAETPSTAVSATYIANGAYDEQVKASSPWTGGTTPVTALTLNITGNPGEAQFSLDADDDATIIGAVQVLSASYTPIDITGTITEEAGDTVSNNLWLSLGSSGIPDQLYTGTIYYKILDGS